MLLKGVGILYIQAKKQPSDWSNTSQLIQSWLNHRKNLLVLFVKTSCNDPINEQAYTTEAVSVFCQMLLEYVSFGHFKIFEVLSEMVENHHPELNGLDRKILDKILDTTTAIVDFNDKYTYPKHFSNLRSDLSQLGEQLAHRLDWEDQLIKAYKQACHYSNQPQKRTPRFR